MRNSLRVLFWLCNISLENREDLIKRFSENKMKIGRQLVYSENISVNFVCRFGGKNDNNSFFFKF